MGSSRHTEPPADQVERMLGNAAYAAARGDEPLVERCLARLGQLAGTQPPSLIARVVHELTDRLLSAAWSNGWQPRDLCEYGRRRLPPPLRTYLVDAIADEHRRYPSAHPRWDGQLDAVGAEVWWRPERYLLPQWAERHRQTRRDALHAAITVAGFLLGLPRLPQLSPPPGSSADASGPATGLAAVHAADDKLLGRIRALLAKAEATEFPEEAEALSAKAQQLMARCSLDRALVEAGSGSRGRPGSASGGGSRAGPTGRRIWVDPPYVSAKTHLVQAVAAANRCRSVSTDQLGFVTVLGDELDLRLVELLTTSLLVQADRAMLAGTGQRAGPGAGQRPGPGTVRHADPGRSRIRSYRRAFLLSYANRIGERLRQASTRTEDALRRSDADRLRPVLADRERQVDALLAELFPHVVTRRVSVSNAAGWAAGRTAADLACLDTRPALPGRAGDSDPNGGGVFGRG